MSPSGTRASWQGLQSAAARLTWPSSLTVVSHVCAGSKWPLKPTRSSSDRIYVMDRPRFDLAELQKLRRDRAVDSVREPANSVSTPSAEKLREAVRDANDPK